MSDVELSTMKEQRFFHVFLQNKSPQGAIFISLFTLKSHLYLIKNKTDTYSIASVSILSRLHNPNIL